MKRIILAVLLALLVLPTVASAQADLTVDQFFLPGSNTSGYRVHASTTSSHLNVSLPSGAVWAERGYKEVVRFSHLAATGLTNTNLSIHGQSRLAATGGTFQRLGYEGSILGVTLTSSAALTAGTATAEPTVQNAGVVRGSGLTVVLSAAGPPQYASRIQARGVTTFDSGHEVGCRITTTNDLAPVNAELLCGVTVEF